MRSPWKIFVVWLVGAAVAFGVSRSAHNWLILPGYLAATAVVYVASLYINPMMRCWRCGGRSWFFGWLFRYAKGQCPRCQNSGRQRRAGAVLLRIPRQ